jgi:anthranilate phosphoribosyltransferase
MQEQDPVKTFIKKVGRGKTLARDLTREEAREAVERLLRGEFTPSQAGAFLQAMRIKETSVEELLGAAGGAESFRQGQFPAQPSPDRHPLVVNLAFDTARKGGILSLPALAFLEQAGLVKALVVWEPPSLFDRTNAVERTVSALKRHPVLAGSVPEMVAVRQMCAPWEGMSPLRRELGFRTILNTLEKLLRPWPTAPVVVGISHDTFSERLCHVLFGLGAPRGAVVRGHHGTCDLTFGENPTECHVWQGERISEIAIEADVFPWASHGAALLLSSLEFWPEWIADGSSPLWGMIRAQAAFLLSVATGGTLAESVQTIDNLPKGGKHA